MAKSFSLNTYNSDLYNSKYGRVLIFTGENYSAFSTSCYAALIYARAFDIVTGAPLGVALVNVNSPVWKIWDER